MTSSESPARIAKSGGGFSCEWVFITHSSIVGYPKQSETNHTGHGA